MGSREFRCEKEKGLQAGPHYEKAKQRSKKEKKKLPGEISPFLGMTNSLRRALRGSRSSMNAANSASRNPLALDSSRKMLSFCWGTVMVIVAGGVEW